MRDFVVYHNPDSMGYSAEVVTQPEIVTKKPVHKLLGDRIWLLTGEGRPRRYYLRATFVVDEIDRDPDADYPNIARGHDGLFFTPLKRIDGQPWFPGLFKSQGQFAFGLGRISDDRIISGLLAIAGGAPSGPPSAPGLGAGFGSPENNAKVERAAIAFVRKHFRTAGWTVISVERDKIGFDLRCTKSSQRANVEVKGIRSSLCSFQITAGEKRRADTDPDFRLAAVTSALTAPKLHSFDSQELARSFEFEPSAYWARPRD